MLKEKLFGRLEGLKNAITISYNYKLSAEPVSFPNKNRSLFSIVDVKL
jgi:hypothetical protein